MIYALWFEDPEKQTSFKRFLRITDETLISFYADCHIFLTAEQVEKHILYARELEFYKTVLQNPNADYNHLKFKDYAKCA